MNRQFTALSGVAMLLIVINHTIQLGTEIPLSLGYEPVTGIWRIILIVLQGLGAFAVPTFLFISGAFIAYAARGQRSVLSVRFIWASLRHILWPYLLWSIIFYIVVYFNRGWQYSPAGYLKNLLVGFPFHFIPLLMFYYFISPLLVLAGKTRGGLLIVLIGGFQFLLLWALNPNLVGADLPAWSTNLVPPILGETLADWAIYFPLGVVYNLHARQINPWLEKFRWMFAFLTVGVFILGILNGVGVLSAPWARYLVPLLFVMLIPGIKRNLIPGVRQLEEIGKRSYGLYLTHLIVLDTSLLLVKLIAPGLFSVYLALLPFLFALALFVPLGAMKFFSQARTRKAYRYVFG